MYEEYFHLSGAPFKLNPDPKYFFGSRSHNKAMAYLHYGLKQAEGFIVITGPIGSGKTMVIGQLLDQLNASNVVAAQLLTSNIEPEELLDHILSAFRIEPEGEGRTGKLEAFEDYLFDQLNRGRRVLLIMDEAQNLPFETLEELRMLSNIDYDGTPLFQVFLVGQPEFKETLQSSRLEQLRQRVIAAYHLENLEPDEAREYIYHRLSVAGWDEDPAFDEAAFDEIYAETKGRPRRINTVCNRIMLYCSLEETHRVTGEIAATVIGELKDEELGAKDDLPVAEPEPMPKVRVIESGETDAATASEREAENDDEVVVSLEYARNRANGTDGSAVPVHPRTDDTAPVMTDADDDRDVASNDIAEKGEEKMVEEETAPTQAIENPPAPAKRVGATSVLDRLKTRREDDASDNKPREEATLADVASAIASAGEKAAQEPDDDELPEAGEVSGEPSAKPNSGSPAAGKMEWRTAMRGSLNETRDELKEAHASVRRLRHSLSEMQQRRRADRETVSASLQRAEELLEALRRSNDQ